MEKIIVNPSVNKDTILSTEVQNLIECNGIILAYENNSLIGSAIFYNNYYILSTISFQLEYRNLSQLLSENSDLTFKFIN